MPGPALSTDRLLGPIYRWWMDAQRQQREQDAIDKAMALAEERRKLFGEWQQEFPGRRLPFDIELPSPLPPLRFSVPPGMGEPRSDAPPDPPPLVRPRYPLPGPLKALRKAETIGPDPTGTLIDRLSQGPQEGSLAHWATQPLVPGMNPLLEAARRTRQWGADAQELGITTGSQPMGWLGGLIGHGTDVIAQQLEGLATPSGMAGEAAGVLPLWLRQRHLAKISADVLEELKAAGVPLDEVVTSVHTRNVPRFQREPPEGQWHTPVESLEDNPRAFMANLLRHANRTPMSETPMRGTDASLVEMVYDDLVRYFSRHQSQYDPSFRPPPKLSGPRAIFAPAFPIEAQVIDAQIREAVARYTTAQASGASRNDLQRLGVAIHDIVNQFPDEIRLLGPERIDALIQLVEPLPEPLAQKLRALRRGL